MNTENLFSELVEKISNEVSKQVLEKFTIKTEKLEGTLNELIQALVQEPREPVKNVPKVETVFEAPTKVRKISQKKEKVRILSTPIAGPGRRPTISEQEFASVLSIAKNPDEVIMAFPVLQKMSKARAKRYVAMRAHNLRKRGVAVAIFRRGHGPKIAA